MAGRDPRELEVEIVMSEEDALYTKWGRGRLPTGEQLRDHSAHGVAN